MGQRIQTIDVHRNGAYHRIFPSETHESSSRLSLHAWNCMHQHAWCPFPRPCCITCPRGGQVSPLPHVLVLGPPRIKHRVNWQCQLGGRVQRVDWIRIRTRKLAPTSAPSDARWTSFCIVLDASAGRFGHPLEGTGRHEELWLHDGCRSDEGRCRDGLPPVQPAKEMEQSQTCREETEAFLDVSSSCRNERVQKMRGLCKDG